MASGMTAWTEAQRAVIGSMMIEPELCAGEIFQTARPSHFGDASLRHIFEAARSVWESNRPLDPVTVAAECGAAEYSKLIADCMRATPTALNFSAWLAILRSSARLSALQSEAIKIINSDATEQTALAAYERMGELLQETEDDGMSSLSELIGDYLDRMQDRTPPDYLSWGLPKLDRSLSVPPGSFVIIAADSSVGKTALALQFAVHIAKAGKRVGFFSIETGKANITDRLMAERQMAKIPLPSTKKKALSEDDFRRATEVRISSDRIPIWVGNKSTTLQQIRAKTLRHRLDVIFIDYLQLIDAPGSERFDVVTGISIALHRMAQQLGVTVVGLSQITPAAKGSKQAPTKDDLRESRQLKQDADVIMMLYPSSDKDDTADVRILNVVKNRDGQCGKMKLRFEAEHMTFTELITMDGLRAEGSAIKAQRQSDGRKKLREDRSSGDPPKLEELDDEEAIPF